MKINNSTIKGTMKMNSAINKVHSKITGKDEEDTHIITPEMEEQLKSFCSTGTKWYLNSSYKELLEDYIKDNDISYIYLCYKWDIKSYALVTGLYKDENCKQPISEITLGVLEKTKELAMMSTIGRGIFPNLARIGYIIDDEWVKNSENIIEMIESDIREISQNNNVRIELHEVNLNYKLKKGLKADIKLDILNKEN